MVQAHGAAGVYRAGACVWLAAAAVVTMPIPPSGSACVVLALSAASALGANGGAQCMPQNRTRVAAILRRYPGYCVENGRAVRHAQRLAISGGRNFRTAPHRTAIHGRWS